MSTMNIAKPKRRTVWDFIKQQPLGFIGLILISLAFLIEFWIIKFAFSKVICSMIISDI